MGQFPLQKSFSSRLARFLFLILAMKAVNVCLSLSPGLSLDQSRGPKNVNECFPCLTLLNRGT